MAPIEFYFDFNSPYGYFASQHIESIASKHKRNVLWKPILLGAIFRVTGGQPPVNVPLKGDYAKRDFARSARHFGVPFKFPSTFPIATQHACRAMYWVSDRDAALGKQLAQRLYQTYLVQDTDISAPEQVVTVASSLGIDAAELSAALAGNELKERFKNEMEAAIAKGVFGSPFFIVDGEPFHGADRMDQVEKWLATGGW